jgi:hypothetical protein
MGDKFRVGEMLCEDDGWLGIVSEAIGLRLLGRVVYTILWEALLELQQDELSIQ